jgi:hypothetical protein
MRDFQHPVTILNGIKITHVPRSWLDAKLVASRGVCKLMVFIHMLLLSDDPKPWRQAQPHLGYLVMTSIDSYTSPQSRVPRLTWMAFLLV